MWLPTRTLSRLTIGADIICLSDTYRFGMTLSVPASGYALVFGLAALASQVPLSASEIAETKTGRLLRAILEPPEPPAEERDRDDEAQERD